MFYSQVILAKKGPLAKVWLAAHWGDKKLARPQIFATDISQSCVDIMNPAVPLALRLSGHLLLGVVRIYSRKVKYVLNDCTEAMLKLQMAFSSASAQQQQQAKQLLDADVGDRELLETTDAQHQLVQNFGEFDQVHLVEGFCLPLPEDNEWILADEDQDQPQDLLLAAHLPTSTQQTQHSPAALQEEEEEEVWAPFDPDNEDDDDEEDDPNQSRVSDIEIVRAANDSLLSEDQTRRSSILDVNKSTLTMDSALDTSERPEHQQQDLEDFAVPFDESEDEEGQPVDTSFGNNDNDTDLRLSTAGTPMANSTLGLHLEDSPNHDMDSRKRTTQPPVRKRRRKRRKVVIDNHDTELTNDHIRNMLQDTDDICNPMVHPASIWDQDNTGMTYMALVKGKESTHLEVPSLTRPFLQDSTKLHPKLQQLWRDNYWKALGNACPYSKQEPVDEMEEIRRAQDEDDDSSSKASELLPVTADKQEFPQDENPDDMEFPPALDDDDDEEEDQDVPVPDFGEEEETAQLQRTTNDDDDELLDLGMVNDMVLDSDDDDDDNSDNDERQALGDTASSSTKWHKHTVRVYKHLQKSLKNPHDDDDEQAELPEAVNFGQLTKHVVSRRNASSVFFEMLQLKTWDFIELQQDESYGNIQISAGVRFGEDAPNH